MSAQTIARIALLLVCGVTSEALGDSAVFRLPLRPEAGALAQEIAGPFWGADDGAAGLLAVRIDPGAVAYGVGLRGGEPAVEVRLLLDVDLGARVELAPLEGSVAPEVDAVARALAAHLDEGVRTGQIGVYAPPPGQRLGPPPDIRESMLEAPWMAWLAIALAALSLAPVVWRARPRAPAVAAFAAWAVGLGALSIGLALASDTVLHETFLGWDTVRVVSAGPDDLYATDDAYGYVHVLLARALGAFADPGHETFASSRVAGVASVLGVAAVGWVLTTSRGVGALAAVALAVQPAFLLAARAETPVTAELFVGLVAFALSVAAGRTRAWPVLVAAAAWTALLAMYRLTGPVLALALPWLWVGAGAPRRWLYTACGLAALAALAALPHGADMLLHVQLNQSGRWERFWAHGAAHSIVTNALLTSPVFWAMAAVGLVVGARRDPAPWVALAVSAALVLVATGPAATDYLGQARYQLWVVAAGAVATAMAARAGWSRGPVWKAAALAGGVAIGATLQTPLSLLDVAQPETAQLYAWRELRALLPTGATLLLPTSHPGEEIHLSLPDTELRAARPDLRVLPWSERDRAHGAEAFVFVPLQCRVQGTERHEGSDCAGLTDVLAERAVRTWELPTRLEQVMGRDLGPDAQGWSRIPYAEEPVRIGLARVGPE
jgi:hypothetical protein